MSKNLSTLENGVNIMLVSHTNAGKTSLVRTLLGMDVGEVLDAPDVTRSITFYDLATGQDASSLRLWDTPGFGDSFRLSSRLAVKHRWVQWIIREMWDRWRNPRLWRNQRVAIDIKQRADVVLYLINSLERPVDAVFVPPELGVLQWVGKPIVAVLNQSGDSRHSDDVKSRVHEWRRELATYPAVSRVLELDSFSRCWVEELTLYDEIGHVLEETKRPTYVTLVKAIEDGHHERFDASIEALTNYLISTATDKESLDAASFEVIRGVFGSVRNMISRGKSEDLQPHEVAMKSLAQRYMDSTRVVTDQLISTHRLTGVTSAEIVQITSASFSIDRPVDKTITSLAGGVVSGFLTGLAADMMAGGMTLGTGAIVGAVLGAAGTAAIAAGYNSYTSEGKKIVGWSAVSLTEAFEKSVLLYLAVAHFGRGQGEWHRREDSEFWKKAVAASVLRRQVKLQEIWKRVELQGGSSSAKAECGFLLKSVLLELLESRYPETRLRDLLLPAPATP